MFSSQLAGAFITEYFRCGERQSPGEAKQSDGMKNGGKHHLWLFKGFKRNSGKIIVCIL